MRDAIVIAEIGPAEQTRVVFVNRGFEALTGVEASAALDRPLLSLAGWKAGSEHDRLRRSLSRGDHFETELVARRPDGAEYMAEVHVDGLRGEDGTITHAVAVLRDVTEKKLVERQLHHLAHHDALTSLPNRKLFQDRLDQAIRRARRYKDSLCVLFVDLDGFKEINDTLGHAAGDQVLRAVSDRLRNVLRESDTVARLGGDEFTLLLPSVERKEDAALVAKKVCDAVSEVIVVSGKELFVTPSIGISRFPSDAAEAESMLRCADIAMYTAKHAGKAQWAFYDPSMQPEEVAQVELADELRQALLHGQLELHWQPLARLHDQRILGVESAIRWRHPQRGLVSPALFLPLLEELDLAEEVFGWAIRETLRSVEQLDVALPEDFTVAVNAFPRLLRRPHFAKIVLEARDAAASSRRLQIEIAEAAVATLDDGAFGRLAALREGGVRVAVDHFGTGNLTLPQLRALPIDALEVDAGFVQRLEHESELLRGIAVLCRSLGLSIAADGVGAEEQRRALQALGVESGKGRLYGVGLTLAELRASLGAPR